MRLFVGINFPKRLRQRIYSAARPLRDEGFPVRWVEPDDFHMTLKFLGEVRRERVPDIERAIAGVAAATAGFATALAGFGAFPTIRRPRVVWIGAEATSELRCLKQDLEWALAPLGFDSETRAFHPHVTLGRGKADGGAGAFRGLDVLMASMTFSSEVRVHTLDLIQTRRTPSGSRYSVVAGARLGVA